MHILVYVATLSPVVLISRYPAILKKFHLNENTGGDGFFKGGDGVIREILFRRPLTLSVLTERRVYSPYGLNGKLVAIMIIYHNNYSYCRWL